MTDWKEYPKKMLRVKAASEAAKEIIIAKLQSMKQGHYECEDGWYSCPKSEEGCLDESDGNKCNCGADEINTEIDEAIEMIKKLGEQNE
jgi:hypothetical protein